jgi:hypothetical protein
MTELSSASISACGRYRYWLERRWSAATPAVFVMLNPSTADAQLDDPTIRRCTGFAKREGHGGLVVVNLFGWRSSDPRQLILADDPVGPGNTRAIGEALLMGAMTSGRVICAWGSNKMAEPQAETLRRRAADFNVNLMCLARTKSGAPKHPLYIAGDAPLIPYRDQP